ncbi:MAG: aminotransferase class V-fold PLP-dependent enzyme [Oscillatoriales cyanobacterium SM2_2_1]|nr:aminotransferase class V-fold PLP-dependent enzyme [Oscillatoriales cyanobacterium SM2_2_1]
MAPSALETWRSQVPALQGRWYFNYGGQGVLHQQVLDAIQQSFAYCESQGSFSGVINHWITEELAQTRHAIAVELGVAAETITLTENTTTGCNIALWSLPWQPGDRLLLTDCEHPGIVAIAAQLQQRFGIVPQFVPVLGLESDAAIIAAIQHHWHPQIKALMISHVLWNTGQILPLKAIADWCHQQGALVIVDAAQSVGVLPLDLTALGVDAYAFTGHKWWCGPVGLGGLYLEPNFQAAGQPLFVGWRGLSSSKNLLPVPSWQPNGAKFEVASSCYPLLAGLRTALDLQRQLGTAQERYDRLTKLSQWLWQHLHELPHIRPIRQTPPPTGLVSFEVVGAAPNALMQRLETQERLLIRALPHPLCLRASIHAAVLESELEHLVMVLSR